MNTLAERSGRTYPHNAIYEILTFRMPTEKRNEPKKYPKATCLKFERILKDMPAKVRKAYRLVYKDGHTLDEAAIAMKCTGPTVRKYLNDIYLTRWGDGFAADALLAKNSMQREGFDSSRVIAFCDMKELEYPKDKMFNVLSSYADGIEPSEIAKFFRMKLIAVEHYIELYKEYYKL